ncbi:MAG: hypothetical protein IJW96_01900 [Clostridia bacterium]|nr:hypothetical protein [Clostridia bacterium]
MKSKLLKKAIAMIAALSMLSVVTLASGCEILQDFMGGNESSNTSASESSSSVKDNEGDNSSPNENSSSVKDDEGGNEGGNTGGNEGGNTGGNEGGNTGGNEGGTIDPNQQAGVGEFNEETEYNYLIKGGDGYYVLEAEYTDVTAIEGSTYSGQAVGQNVIVKDSNNSASNGFYVNYLYEQYNTLFFDIYSDKDVTGVELVMRIAGYYDTGITINYNDYKVVVSSQVNGEWTSKGVYYEDINLGDNYLKQNGIFYSGGFADHTISTTVSLKAGYNRISLITNNDKPLSSKGDMSCTAPVVDCIKLKTDAVLQMDIWDQYDTLK